MRSELMADVREIPEADFRAKRSVIATIQDGLSAFNQENSPDPAARHLVLYTAEDDLVTGGLIGRIARDWLRVDTLWVAKASRGQGLGKALLLKAEHIARFEGCHSARLDTYSFQAHDFYQQFGYEEFARLDELKNGDTQYFLKKRL